MSTTALFVELVVIGTGSLASLFLLTFAVFGTSWVAPLGEAWDLAIAAAVVIASYVLGIGIDRLADWLFHDQARTLQDARFQDEARYDAARLLVYRDSPLRELFEYARSRMRIARGWVVNSGLLLISGNLYVWLQLRERNPRSGISVFGSAVLLGLGTLCYLTWRNLVRREAENLQTQAEWVRSNPPRGAP